MRLLSIVIIFAFCCSGCQNPTDADAPKKYYDVKGFVASQIKKLESRKPLVNKEMTLGEATEKKSTTDINWAKELELFSQADLNKQAYQLSYSISEKDGTYLYTLKPGEKLLVKSLKVVVNQQTKEPSLIEASFQEENKLYDTEKNISLTCAMRPEGVWLLNTYVISGFQHLTLTEKKQFLIKGTIQ